ncbi:ABC-type glycerol-3-phosphate transport system permease component [Streptomyces sp. LBL]|uniref:carbohydrate ABC transporter permease n=1 Tax=Streptomyces sp. LBL TaxID=2940562 RepID=UPI00247528B0|nr:carbohydrate ABC transporter permease [Streptomyces sp. LBL]MDH6622264.1 ABC-type glycerol-3-phosphate transport system permease component [Streptomyces sp. LBL]
MISIDIRPTPTHTGAGTPTRPRHGLRIRSRKVLRIPSIGTIIRFLAVLVLAAVVFLPVYVSFVSAFTPNGEMARSGIVPNPAHVTLRNFHEATTAIPLLREYLVSVGVVTLQTVGQLLTGALAAYALVFPRWRGRRLAFGLVLVTLAIPGESIVIPNYELVSSIGLRDTVLGVVIPYLAAGYPIFLLRQAFAAVPFEIWEAARLDGAGDLRALFTIIMPTCRPQVTNAIIWSALAAWNGFFWPLLITDTAAARTIQVGISQLAASEAGSPSVIFAGAVLVVVPTMLLVIFAQRFLINGLSRGVLR